MEYVVGSGVTKRAVEEKAIEIVVNDPFTIVALLVKEVVEVVEALEAETELDIEEEEEGTHLGVDIRVVKMLVDLRKRT